MQGASLNKRASMNMTMTINCHVTYIQVCVFPAEDNEIFNNDYYYHDDDEFICYQDKVKSVNC